MSHRPSKGQPNRKLATEIVHSGRDPQSFHGFVNTPVYRGSTVLFPSLDAIENRSQRYVYGRRGTPTTTSLEDALTQLEGGAQTALLPSGMAAVAAALTAFTASGDHILMPDSCYQPARHFCDTILKRMGIETTYYDPLIGSGIAALMQANTTVVYLESPGSQTFEVQDVPAIAAIGKEKGAWVLMDNTWATPLFFRPLDHGVDVSIHAATKYVVGHADAMLGALTANARAGARVVETAQASGYCAGSEEVFLGLRGLRSMKLRLEHHHRAGIEMAQWLAARPEVERVLHPALPSCPGHSLWKRDYCGASGLFSIILKPISRTQLAAMLDGMALFGIGFSWGGYESLIVPFDAAKMRTATAWPPLGQSAGPALRLHIGLEDLDDLKHDLAEGFARAAAAG